MYRVRNILNGMTAAVTLVAAALGLVGALMFGATRAHAQQTVICTQTHIVQRGETLYRIARQYSMTTTVLQAMNGIPNANRIYVGQSLCVAQQVSGGTTYVVQAGDTLGRIARRFGVDMNVLARINGISNPNRIYTGQTLIIPDVTIQG
ncbi:MAG: LysM peptidoglycan-binding domain-containing protein [Chloroflexota bacterium]|nr:LysM peptidoglycan-binding domain-containing protein [Chloroflexota bacterium]